MNRKGFTLMEMIAVVVILGIILLIAGPTLSSVYEDSKLKSEEIFTKRLSQSIDSYIKLNSSDINFTSDGTANKTEENASYQVNIYKGTIKVQNIINDNLLSIEDYKNAGNKDIQCNSNAEIELYRDSDYVYCYKVKKNSLDCLTDRYKNSVTGEYVIDTCIWSK